MAQKRRINEITPDTLDWTCKVQVVDRGRECQNEKKKIMFQTFILEDEEVQQVKAILFEGAIGHYKEKFKLFETYLIYVAKVKESSLMYGAPLFKFYWQIDKETVVEPVGRTGQGEAPLPPPSKLSVVPFEQVPHISPHSNEAFDIISVVVRCGPPKLAGHRAKKCQEITVVDKQDNQLLITLWEDFAHVEETQLALLMKYQKEFLAIIAISVEKSPYRGLSLQTKFNTIIQINPSYRQALELFNWCLFHVDLVDESGSTTATIAGDIGERLLEMTVEEIYEITGAKMQLLPVKHIHK